MGCGLPTHGADEYCFCLCVGIGKNIRHVKNATLAVQRLCEDHGGFNLCVMSTENVLIRQTHYVVGG